MSTVATPAPTKLTAADLLAMSDDAVYELVDGRLEAKNVGFESSRVAARLIIFLGLYCDKMKLGCVLGCDAGYQCFPEDLQKVRKPDASFINIQRMPPEEVPVGFIPMPPDLAVEVISPNDLASEVGKKVEEYLNAGVKLVWVIDPATGRVLVHRPNGGQILSALDELSGEDVVPGFRVKIADLLNRFSS